MPKASEKEALLNGGERRRRYGKDVDSRSVCVRGADLTRPALAVNVQGDDDGAAVAAPAAAAVAEQQEEESDLQEMIEDLRHYVEQVYAIIKPVMVCILLVVLWVKIDQAWQPPEMDAFDNVMG